MNEENYGQLDPDYPVGAPPEIMRYIDYFEIKVEILGGNIQLDRNNLASRH
jgi:hypothetical protein